MLYTMSRAMQSNDSVLVFDTDDLTLEDTKCSDIRNYVKQGGTVVFPFLFHTSDLQDCRVATHNEWFVIYAMSHEPKSQGMYLQVGKIGLGVFYETRVSYIVWNAYPVLSLDSSHKNALIQLDWTDKHFYGEDRSEGLVKFIGIDADGNEVLNTVPDVAMDCGYWSINARGELERSI